MAKIKLELRPKFWGQSPSSGFLVGPSVTANVASGSGPWSGSFTSSGGSYDVFTGGTFESVPSENSSGYAGVNFGLGKGLPGVGSTTTNYSVLLHITHPNGNCSG